MPFVSVVKKPGFQLLRSKGLVLVKFEDLGDLSAVKAYVEAMRETVKLAGHVTSLGVVPINDSMTKVPAEVRDFSAESIRAMGADVAALSTVLLGKGLGAMVMRTFMGVFNMMTKGQVPQKTFGSIEDSLAWLATVPRCAEDVKGVDAAEVLRLLELAQPGKKAA